MIPIWQMREENQATIIVALITAIVAVATLIIQWWLHRHDRMVDEKRHEKEMEQLRKDSQAHEIKALDTVNRKQWNEIKALEDRAHALDAISDGTKALLLDKLSHLHAAMVKRGGWCPDDQKRVAQRVYKSYHTLGGNSLGTAWVRDILSAHSSPKASKNSKGSEAK